MTKTILFHWNKTTLLGKPLSRFRADVRDVYLRLFDKLLQEKALVFLAGGEDTYLGENRFTPQYQYLGNNEFNITNEIISPNMIFDKWEKNITFPPVELKNVLNPLEFKLFAKNKWKNYLAYKQSYPKTHKILKREDLNKAFKKFPKNTRLVLKPVWGSKGNNIYFGNSSKTAELIGSYDKLGEPKNEFILQKFVDTSEGIPGLISGYHDLRFIFLNNVVIDAYLRTPVPGELLANEARGGRVIAIELDTISKNILDFVEGIAQDVFVQFNNPIFSIDIGVERGKPYIFEMNDQPGFPGKDEIIWIDPFVDNLAKRLLADN